MVKAAVGGGRSALRRFFPAGLLADLEDLPGCQVDVLSENGPHWYIRLLAQIVSQAPAGRDNHCN